MLYVFIVSSGRMMQFEMSLAVKKVLELKNEIARRAKIPQEKQVLLCSGGEELMPDNIVGHYKGAGTDTNPIFLFSKCVTEMEPYSSHLNTSAESSIESDVNDCANMQPTIATATVSIALAQRFAESASKGREECEELVHSQHLQQQGWAAVIANLEDVKEILEKRKEKFEILYQNYMTNRSSFLETIYMFPSNIELLAKIPLISKLIIDNTDEDLITNHTLLSWFVTEPREVLEALVDKCHHLLEEYNEHTIIGINEEFERVLKNVDNPDIKEIKGIGERLTRLNAQIQDARKLEKDQIDLALKFKKFHAMIANDHQILPDLCKTLHGQLEIMLENHKCLREILNRCTNAKLELSGHINFRLKYIGTYEDEMYRLHTRVTLLENHIQSVMSQVESFRQVQIAPERYLKMLAEVCRRKTFSASFMKWAEDLSSQASKVYHKEIDIRKSFSSSETKNMVDNLFPGMSDVPPKFAVECPSPFDQNLPNIGKEDLEWLKINLPELSHFCEVIPVDPMPYVSQTESDSAFSSNVPFSRVASDSAGVSEKVHDTKELPIDKLAVPSGDFSSLPSEYASLPNEVFSLTSSPFEDPMLPSHMQEQRTKQLQVSLKGPYGDQTNIADSDGEEFETVDHYRMSPVAATSQSAYGLRARPPSSSDVIDVNTHPKHSPRVVKARSDGDAVSPMQERLKSPDSLAISTDFQAAEYYIDDSMPSSYTESNATSPLMRGNRMVKSHHVVVAELQRQVDEKSGALVVTKKFIQELHGSFRSDFSNFKASVTEDLCDKMAEVSQVVDHINTYIGKVEQQMISDKDTAISEMKQEFSSIESSYLRKLEVENQKLSDAENQIVYYEDHLKGLRHSYEETKHEKEMLESELQEKKELIQRMMLEHEVEFDSFKNSVKEQLQSQELEINQLKQSLSQAILEVTKLEGEKTVIEKESQERHNIVSSMQDQHDKLKEEFHRLQVENRSVKSLQEFEKKLDDALKEKNIYIQELENAKEELQKCKDEMEKMKTNELKDLEEKLSVKHKNDLDSLRSRFKLAVSMTSLEKLPSSSSPDFGDTESLECLEELQKIIAESREKWESVKLNIAKEEHAKELNALKESFEESQLKHEEEKVQIIAAMRSKHENALEKLKSRITAENQVSFNEAINSLAKEKDAIIENLRSSISVLEAKQIALKTYLDQFRPSLSPIIGEDVITQSETGATSACARSADELFYFNKFKTDVEALLQLTDTTKKPYQQTRSSSDSYESLRKKLKIKEEEYSGLLSKFMSSSASISRTPCVHCSNKLSILTCEPGETVLVCYEDKLEHYIIFHLGNYLHFLHSDSIASLDLKSPGESQRWIIGTVTHKEFCVTKKVNNRFKLTLGTKFYRVKIEKWSCGVAATRTTAAALQRSIQISSTEQQPQTASAIRNSEQTATQTQPACIAQTVDSTELTPSTSFIQASISEQQLSSQSIIEVQNIQPTSSGVSQMSSSDI
ncbi:RB1-inducible coiled-coil protein 1 isoform X2 [Parasteatoda tepidariorum]|uniref:RB1-inducible coiled-coil protein 1 isoform X2 n=1 Tax=Parasteatoda tepidariorum TaxID=114398 RepID=UPI001C7232FD|nr:RB1-inducible coiled-coil protein 1 isoform X2 [Parasteatoda tepidariorum]